MFIRHEQFLDVAIEVQSIRRNLDGAAVVHGTFWNMGVNKSYVIGEQIKLKIDKTNYNKWLMCSLVADEFLRTSLWEEFKV